MASAHFRVVERNLRRFYWLSLLEEMNVYGPRFRASLVVSPRTGLPLETAGPAIAIDVALEPRPMPSA